MEPKYYVPEISEFCIGFEFEIFECSGESEAFSSWQEHYIKSPNSNGWIWTWERLNEKIKTEELRVKYLDSSDIEELGFTYKGKTIDVWFEKEGNFDMGTWTSYKCQLHYGLHDNRLFIDMIDMGDEVRVFNGIVKNKSELKKVLNMLNIK